MSSIVTGQYCLFDVVLSVVEVRIGLDSAIYRDFLFLFGEFTDLHAKVDFVARLIDLGILQISLLAAQGSLLRHGRC